MIPGLDVHSESWRAIRKWAREELIPRREKLERQRLDERDSEFIRGEIKQLKAVIALGDEKKAPDIPPPTQY